jgi:CubicO group peptidase (beta-lactamase class C family)
MKRKFCVSVLSIPPLIMALAFWSHYPFDRTAQKIHSGIQESLPEWKQQSFNWPLSTPEAQGLDSRIFQNAVQHARDLGFVDSLLVLRNGFLISENYFNGYDMETPHPIASASKTFIGALVGIAVREGLLSLDQKLLDFYPDYVSPNMDPRKNDITIRHLLQMLSGFWDVDTMLSSNRIKYAIEYIPLYSDPGIQFYYSTVGVHLLSGIITRASGMSTLDFALMYLFDSLGISVASWSRDPAGIYTGGFGMEFTPRNLARLGYLYVQGGALDGLQIIPEDYFQESWTASEPSNGMLGTYDAIEESGYGFLWWIAKMGGYWTYFARGHGGQHIIVVPGLNMAIVMNGKLYYYADFHHVAGFRLSAYLILNPIRDWLGDPPYAPENARGVKRINRSLGQKEYINEITWEPSARNQGIDVLEYRIYKIHSATKREILTRTDTNTFFYRQRGAEVQEKSEHIYGITTVTRDLRESIPAYVIIYRPENGEGQ